MSLWTVRSETVKGRRRRSRQSCLGVCLAAALVLLVATPLWADGESPGDVDKWVSWQFQEENDVFAVLSQSDEFYTQGLRLSAVRHPDFTPRWAETLGKGWWGRFFPERPGQVSFGVEFGQHIFTPTDISVSTLQTDDRPYAGWLYGGILLYLDELDSQRRRPVQQVLELQFGVVGPESLADEAQTEVHRLIDDELPQGWDNQLPFEPGLNLFYLLRQRIGSRYLDLVPHVGGALGNLQIYGNVGATVRFGYNIAGFPLLQNTASATSTPTSTPGRNHWEAYAYLGVDGRLIARNLFLDGSTFKDSHSIDRRDVVYDLIAGVTVRYRAFRFKYALVRRSQELKRLPPGFEEGSHDYGSLSFSWERAFK